MSKVINKDKNLNSFFCHIEDISFKDFIKSEESQQPLPDLSELKKEAENILFEAKTQAVRIIEDSQRQAQEALDNAQQIIEERKKEGFQQGYSDGLHKAEAEVEARYAQIIQKEINQLRDIARAFQESYTAVIKNAQGYLVKLVLDIAKKVIRQEAVKNKQIVLDMVKEALLRVVEKSKIVVHINPEQIDFVKQNKEKLLSSLEGVDNFELRQDPKVDIGGCIIETPSGSVEARLEKQFQEIRKALTGEDKEANGNIDVSHVT